jgi:8-oxo-dGTP diphosphatase
MEQVAVILLQNANGEILLQHRSADAPTYPDHWAFFGGHIEDGETPEQAVAREAMEELQYELERPALFKVHTSVPNCVIYVFVADYSGAELVLGEGQGMRWFVPSETKHLLMNDHDRSILEEFAASNAMNSASS